MNISLPKDTMLEILDDPKMVVRDRIASRGRWNVTHELIFRHGGKLYRTHYRIGATESQEESPWEHDADIECVEMRECMSPDYEPAPPATAGGKP